MPVNEIERLEGRAINLKLAAKKISGATAARGRDTYFGRFCFKAHGRKENLQFIFQLSHNSVANALKS